MEVNIIENAAGIYGVWKKYENLCLQKLVDALYTSTENDSITAFEEKYISLQWIILKLLSVDLALTETIHRTF